MQFLPKEFETGSTAKDRCSFKFFLYILQKQFKTTQYS